MTSKLQEKYRKSKIFGFLFDGEFDFKKDYLLDYLETLLNNHYTYTV